MRLVVGTPWSSPFMWTGYVDAMLNLQRPPVARNARGDLEPLETAFVRGAGWCPARRHAHICEQALDLGADLICIVGADQVHPPDMLLRLVEHWNNGCEVISALVPARGYVSHQDMRPFQRVAWRITPHVVTSPDDLATLHAAPNATEIIDPAAGDLQRIHFIGSGVLMFATDHLRMLKLPWFAEQYDPQTMRRLACMDTGFVWRLQTEAGAAVWVDTTIKVKHLHAFPVDETYAERFTDWMEPGVGDPAICFFQGDPQRDAA